MSQVDVSFLKPRFLPDTDSQREWGGKGAPLARMIRKGFTVPPTAAMGLTQVRQWLETLPEYKGAIEAWRSWSDLSALDALEQAILRAEMPEHWVLSVGTIRKFLCGDDENEAEPWPLILRSSMSAEDGAGGSMAGCFESVCVREAGAEPVWTAFKHVVASAYRRSSAERLLGSGVDPRAFSAGVVIQPYLNAELAGVCFSRENPWLPGTGLVEWVSGAGEALVQGTAPSQQARQGDAMPAELAGFWQALWKGAAKAEKIVGGPADLEWVWDGQQLWWVQARPVATAEARLAARAPGRTWTRELTLERFPEPMTPMGWSILQEALAQNLETLDRRFGIIAKKGAKNPSDMAVAVRGTVYADPRFFDFPGGVRVRWSRYVFSSKPWLVAAALVRFGARVLKSPLPVARAQLKLDVAQALMGAQSQALESSWDAHREQGLKELGEFKPTIEGVRSEADILARMQRLGEISTAFMEPDFAVYLVKDTLSKALLGLCRALGWSEAEFADLFRSFEGNRTLEMNSEWRRCIESLGVDPARERFVEALVERDASAEQQLGLGARDAWRAFMERNGHSTTTWDIAQPTWSDDPSQLVPLLKAALSGARSRGVVPSHLREQARARLVQAVGSTILSTLDRIESLMRIDEEHHFLSGLLLVPSRALILAGADCMVARGLLAQRQDVFFVTIEELKAALAPGAQPMSLTLAAQRRRSEWERAKKATPPFELPEAFLDPLVVQHALGVGQWQGNPMSPGIVIGRAVIAEHLDQVAGIEAGSILITTSPNPALTPLYPLLGGLVSATGSSLSHGFVSAREYALPAVAGIRRATQEIPAGAMIRVDGTTGRVEVVP